MNTGEWISSLLKSIITVCASRELALRVEFTKREFLRRMLKSVIDELTRMRSDKDVSFSRTSRLFARRMTKSYDNRGKE